MNRHRFAPALILAAATLGLPAAEAAVPAVEKIGAAALSGCPAQLTAPTIYHFDKIVFMITGQLLAANAADQPALNALPRNIELDVKLRDTPTRIADLRSKVLTFIGAVANSDSLPFIRILQVSYTAIACPKSP